MPGARIGPGQGACRIGKWAEVKECPCYEGSAACRTIEVDELMIKEKDRFITIQHAAQRLSVKDRFVYGLIQDGLLTAIRLGPRTLRVSEKSLDRYITSQQVDPAALYDPGDPPEELPSESAPQKPARSQWMSK